MKSNASATAIKKSTVSKSMATRCSGALEDDALDDVRDVLAAIGNRLQVLVDFLELDQLARVGLVPKEFREGRAQSWSASVSSRSISPQSFMMVSAFFMLSRSFTAALTFSAQATQISARRLASSGIL